MKIAYDGKRAVRNLTGLGNYSRLVIETMAEAFPDDDHLVYTPDLRSNPRLQTLRDLDNVAFRLPDRFWPLPKAVWRSWGVTAQARKDGAEIFHGLSNELPLNIQFSPMASVVTIHDVIYRRLPDCYSAIDRKLYDWKYGFSVRHADRVIAISEATRRDVVELYGVPEDRIDVIRQGISPIFYEQVTLAQRRNVRDKYHLPGQFLLQVGTIEQRKNLETTIRALSALPAEIHLVAVGSGGSYLRKMLELAQELDVMRRVHILKKVPFTDLPALYQTALAAVYPSRYEGFGLPVVEALAGGTPTITTNVSSLPEAGGDAAFLVSPDDARGISDAVRAIIAGSVEVDDRRARGRRHALSFSSSDIASRIRATYLKALETKKSNRH